MDAEEPIGRIVRYEPEEGRARVFVEHGPLKAGDLLRFEGADSDFAEAVHSLERDQEPVLAVEEGREADVWIRRPVEEGTQVRRMKAPYVDEDVELTDRLFGRLQR